MLPKIKIILYPTNLGPGAPHVFRYALALAREHEAKIVAVHAIEPLSQFGQSLLEQYISHDSSEQMHAKARESVKEQLQERLERFCAEECNGFTNCENIVTSIQVVDGYPPLVILDTARDCAADLIVMGAHHHTMVGEMIGSTTRKVLHNADLPVLVVTLPREES